MNAGQIGRSIWPFRTVLNAVVGTDEALGSSGLFAIPHAALIDRAERTMDNFFHAKIPVSPGQLLLFCSRDSAFNSLCSELIAFEEAERAHARRLKALEEDGCVLLVSLRQAADDIVLRALARNAGVQHSPLKNEEERRRRFLEAASEWESLPLCINDACDGSSTAIVRAARTCGRIWGLNLIVVDDLDRLDVGWRRGEAPMEALARKVALLRSIAQEFSVPIVVLVRLASRLATSTQSQPGLADLTAMGYVVHANDLVLFGDLPWA